MAMYEGIIALAWADHELADAERQKLKMLVDQNPHLSDEQRARLYHEIEHRIALSEIWPRITSKQDRAYLLDIAEMIFHSDGDFCAREQSLYHEFYARHMATLDSDATMQELQQMAMQLRAAREAEEQAIKDHVERYGLFPRLQRYLNRLVG